MKIPAARLLLAAAIAGVAGDVLLRGGSQWRVGFVLWIGVLVAGGLLLDRNGPRERKLLMAGVASAAFGLVMRNADLLYGIDFLSILCMGMLLIWHGTGQTLANLTVVEAVRAGMLALLNTLGGAVGVLGRSAAERTTVGADAGRTRALVIGVVLAIPPLVIVAALLTSDRVFNGVLQRVIDALAVNALGHLFIAATVGWFAAGWLRAATGDALGSGIPTPQSPGLRFVSVAVPLYALVGLLTLYLATQARVLFGGATYLQQTLGLTVATYAREGFAQLIVAAGIVLGTLIVAEWLLRADDVPARRHLQIAGAILLGLVTALLVSAAARIAIYVQSFGHSVDRTFAIAAIVWVLLALITCAVTTLRHRPERFASSVVIATVVWVIVLNVLNPEALVVRANVARAASGAEFDTKYHAQLSADALPALVSLAGRLPVAHCQALQAELLQVWTARRQSDGAVRDWRGLSVPYVRMERWYANGAILSCGALQ